VKLEDRIRQGRNPLVAEGRAPVATSHDGVTKERVRSVLRRLDLEQADIVDAVFALLDDTRPSWFSGAPVGATFAEGASTAHVACHVGILQRDATRLDREGRDYWIKPLRDIGAIEAVYLDAERRIFVLGHPVPKSPNSAYRLNTHFKAVLQAPEEAWSLLLDSWSAEDATRERLRFQAEMAEMARAAVDTGHTDLIGLCRTKYARNFLPGFEVLYEDSADGERVDVEDRERLATAGLTLRLGDAMPDLILWHPDRDELWIIEAVMGDGEVDAHKVRQVTAWAERAGKAKAGFTTACRTWKEAAAWQGRHKNIAPGACIWIAEDPSKHWLAEAFDE
jgi:hypothetical protein